jgi:diguanylate cyclase (GGDEF)-like protein
MFSLESADYMSARVTVPTPASRRAVVSFKLRLAGYFLLLSLLPLIAAVWGFTVIAGRAETGRVDARLGAGLRASLAAYGTDITAAQQTAYALAHDPTVVSALQNHDRVTLLRIIGPSTAIMMEAGKRFRVGTIPPFAAVRRDVVSGPNGVIGDIAASVPLDAALVHDLGLRSGLEEGDRLLLVHAGVVTAGMAGQPVISLIPGKARTVVVDGARWRMLTSTPLDEPAGTAFAIASPQASIDHAASVAKHRIWMAFTAALALLALVAIGEGRAIVRNVGELASAARAIAAGKLGERVPVRGRDEFAQLGNAFNEMAEQLQARMAELEAERMRLHELTSRFGEALASTHDVDALLPVIVETAVEATRADGGVLDGAHGERVEFGDPRAGGETIQFPLTVGRDSFGTLTLYAESFDDEQVETAATLVGHAVIALENARLHRIVQRQALVDGLTGLANRRQCEYTLATECARAERFGGPLAFVIADLDDFKLVNDRFGHPAGDLVLREFAEVLRQSVREIDLAGRWGGEEFALVLPGADLGGGVHLAERVRESLERRTILLADGTPVRITASFGVAALPGSVDERSLVEAADAAMYRAKRTGKNRVVAAEEPVAQA